MQLYRLELKGGLLCFLFILVLLPFGLSAQFPPGTLKGKVFDAVTQQPLQGVTINKTNSNRTDKSLPDGSFVFTLDKGVHTISFSLPGFQTLQVEQIRMLQGAFTGITVYLLPLNGSYSKADSTTSISYKQYEKNAPIFSALGSDHREPAFTKTGGNVSLFKDVTSVLSANRGLVLAENPSIISYSSFFVSGMGDRYNPVFINGSPQPGVRQFEKSYSLQNMPAELLEESFVKERTDGSLPADFGGGNIFIKLKERPDRNFFFFQLGTEFFSANREESFYGQKRKFTEFMSLPGFTKKLPGGFPETRSEFRLSQKNPQERVDLLKTLPNNLAPVDLGKADFGNRLTMGWGRNYLLKSKQKLSVLGYLHHQSTEEIFKSEAGSVPNVSKNRYPFSNANSPVINSISDNLNFKNASQLTAFASATINWNKSKISVNAVYMGQNIAVHTQRGFVRKPDEDSFANKGIRNFIEQRRTTNIFISGEHAMGQKGIFRFNWRVNYNNYKQFNPDDLNFLLRQDSVRDDFYKLAQQQTQPLPDRNSVGRSQLDANLDAIFPNSYRSWRKLTDHFFTAAADLSVPLNFLRKQSVLGGGLYLQTQYRELYSDLLLYRGGDFNTLDALIAPQRYFPGGTDAEEYYTPLIGSTGSFNPLDVNADNYGNYLGSINVGAAYLNIETKISNKLALLAALRVESTSQLISLYEYHYFSGFKNAEKITLDENVNVASFDVLPVVKLTYRPVSKFEAIASYFRTLNRPHMQELTDYRIYDPELFMVRNGNRLLTNTSIDNFRADIHFYLSQQSFISLAGYYKKIYRPIENLVTGFASSTGNLRTTPFNMPEATVYGLQLSFKTALSNVKNYWLSRLNVFGSANLTESEVKRGPIKSLTNPFVEKHTLSGTPRYAVNAGISLDFPRLPGFALILNSTADYISAVGSGNLVKLVNGNEVLTIPHYYTKGRAQLDLQVFQPFFKSKLKLIAGINNILAEATLLYQDLNGNKKYDEALVSLRSNGSTGFYKSGIDNTPYRVEGQRSFYVRLSYQIQ